MPAGLSGDTLRTAVQQVLEFSQGKELTVPLTVKKSEKYPTGEITKGEWQLHGLELRRLCLGLELGRLGVARPAGSEGHVQAAQLGLDPRRGPRLGEHELRVRVEVAPQVPQTIVVSKAPPKHASSAALLELRFALLPPLFADDHLTIFALHTAHRKRSQ